MAEPKIGGPELAKRIEQLRDEHDWSDRELARRAGLKNEKHVSIFLGRLRKGGATSSGHARTLNALAEALGTSADALLRLDWRPPRKQAEQMEHALRLRDEIEAPFPNLELMVRYTKASGTYRWEDSTIALLRAGTMTETDMPPEEWQTAADHLQAQVTAARLSWEQMRLGEHRAPPHPPAPKRLGPKRNN